MCMSITVCIIGYIYTHHNCPPSPFFTPPSIVEEKDDKARKN